MRCEGRAEEDKAVMEEIVRVSVVVSITWVAASHLTRSAGLITCLIPSSNFYGYITEPLPMGA